MPNSPAYSMLLRRAADAMDPDRQTPTPKPDPAPADAKSTDA